MEIQCNSVNKVVNKNFICVAAKFLFSTSTTFVVISKKTPNISRYLLTYWYSFYMRKTALYIFYIITLKISYSYEINIKPFRMQEFLSPLMLDSNSSKYLPSQKLDNQHLPPPIPASSSTVIFQPPPPPTKTKKSPLG